MRKPTVHPFWERVKKIIRSHKTSQEKFASHLNVNCNTMKHWMCYGILPDVVTASNIADALGVSIEFLVKGDDGDSATGSDDDEVITRKLAVADIRRMALQIERSACVIG